MSRRARISDAERCARVVARHHLGRTATDVVATVRAVTALHSSDPVTPYLALWARVPGFATGDLDRVVYYERRLWRLHAMRRTLFVVPVDDVSSVQAAASRDIAAKERRRLETWLAGEIAAARVATWLTRVEARVAEVLADGAEWRTQDLTAAVPELATQITVGSGRWVARTPVSSRLLFLLAMEGRVVRTRPVGSWRSSQYRWSDVTSWFGGQPTQIDAAAGRAQLARCYLDRYGPATIADVRWWTGWTVKQTAAAIAAIDAVTVELESGDEGLVLADDAAPPASDGHAVALLPGLDPTPMGWKQRRWYLSDHAERLFDSNGNVGPTVWLDGRVVGGWGQRPGGEVVFRLLEDVGADATERIFEEAAALTGWLGGVMVATRFPTPLERELSR